jgi:hypothetical protein
LKKIIAWCVSAAMAVGTLVSPAAAQFSGVQAPVAAAAQASTDVEQVQHRRIYRHRGYRGHRGYYRGGRGYGRHRGYYGGRGYYGRDRYYGHRRYGYRRHNHGGALALGVLGLAAGAAIANSGGSSQSYCASRYRSYDARTGTYLGYDGRRHACR